MFPFFHSDLLMNLAGIVGFSNFPTSSAEISFSLSLDVGRYSFRVVTKWRYLTLTLTREITVSIRRLIAPMSLNIRNLWKIRVKVKVAE